jgi:hypothetical protein
MSVSSPCEVCGTADVEGACQRCGRLVCERHFEADLGLCVECAAEVGDRPTTVPSEEDMPDGVDTYRF